MKILSIEDSKAIRQTIKNIIEVIGVDLLEAENGKEGLLILESQKDQVGLILLDMEMPVMDGHDFLKAVKADNRFKNIPVIMLTAISQKEQIIHAIRTGARQYITKPFSNEDLLIKIMQALSMDSLDDF